MSGTRHTGTLNPSIAIIGAGVSGLAMAIRLGRTGIPFTIFEKADEIGGT